MSSEDRIESFKAKSGWDVTRIQDFEVQDNAAGGCDIIGPDGDIVATLPDRSSSAFTLMIAGALALGNVNVFDNNRPEYLASCADSAGPKGHR